jgi:hypothetical protein
LHGRNGAEVPGHQSRADAEELHAIGRPERADSELAIIEPADLPRLIRQRDLRRLFPAPIEHSRDAAALTQHDDSELGVGVDRAGVGGDGRLPDVSRPAQCG